jgi:hypothetical protein
MPSVSPLLINRYLEVSQIQNMDPPILPHIGDIERSGKTYRQEKRRSETKKPLPIKFLRFGSNRLRVRSSSNAYPSYEIAAYDEE